MFFKMLIEVGHSNFEVKESITFRLANFSDWGLVFGYTIFILKPGLSNALFSRSIHVKATKLTHGLFGGSLAELEKIFEIAVNGSNEEKISVATILCGASLIHGWKVQVINSST